MKKIWKISVLPALFVLIGTGCTGVTILDMNRELSSLHTQRVAMNAELKSARNEATRPEEIGNLELMLADIDNNLIELAERAQNVAEKADKDGHDLDAISFYRIGAVAALLGGAANLTNLTANGSGKCDQQKGGISAAPRDCAMLKTIDYLAINAKLAPKLEILAAEEKELKQLRINPKEWILKIKETRIRVRTINLFNELSNTAAQILKIQAKISSPGVPVSDRFKNVLGMRAFTVACNANYALVILDNLTLPSDFDKSRIPVDLKIEMQQSSQELKDAKKLKADLDEMLIVKADVINCEGK